MRNEEKEPEDPTVDHSRRKPRTNRGGRTNKNRRRNKKTVTKIKVDKAVSVSIETEQHEKLRGGFIGRGMGCFGRNLANQRQDESDDVIEESDESMDIYDKRYS